MDDLQGELLDDDGGEESDYQSLQGGLQGHGQGQHGQGRHCQNPSK